MNGPRRCLTAGNNAAHRQKSHASATAGASLGKLCRPLPERTKKERLWIFAFLCRIRQDGDKSVPIPTDFARPLRSGTQPSHLCPAFPNGDRQPATRPPPLPSLPSFKIKVFGKDGGDARGEGRTFFQKGSPFPPANKQQTIPAYTLKKRNRSALLTTEKDDRAMAVPAIMGESMGPPKTCSSPAATGRPSRL